MTSVSSMHEAGHPKLVLCDNRVGREVGGGSGWRGHKSIYGQFIFSSVQSLSRVRLCGPMNRSTPGLPVHHQFPESTQTHVHRVDDAIQPSHQFILIYGKNHYKVVIILQLK